MAIFDDMAREMAADGFEGWKTELAECGTELQISQATFDRVLAEVSRDSAQRASISMEIDKSAIESFFVGHICQLRVRLVNRGTRTLKSVCLRWTTTSCNDGIKEDRSRSVARDRDAILTASIQPKVPGQHTFEGIISAMDYGRHESHLSFRAVSFQVAEPKAGPQSVTYQTNVDMAGVRATNMRGATIGAGGTASEAAGRLMVDGDWVEIRVSSINDAHVDSWVQRHTAGSSSSENRSSAAAGSTDVSAPAGAEPVNSPQSRPQEDPTGPPALPNVKYHYAGPAGRFQLTSDEVRYKIRQSPDGAHKVWKEGWSEWKPWNQVPELANAIPRAQARTHQSGTRTRPRSKPSASTAVAAPQQRQKGHIALELVDAGSAGSQLIRLICELGELSLGEAVKGISRLPLVIAYASSQVEAKVIVSRVAETGAQARVRSSSGVARAPTAPAPRVRSAESRVMPRGCPSCGAMNLGKVAFCRSCGTALPTASAASAPASGSTKSRVLPRDCPACGTTNLGKVASCRSCGAALGQAAGNSGGNGSTSSFGVELRDTGGRLLQLVSLVAGATGQPSGDVQRLISALPYVITTGLAQGDARLLADKIQKAGGTAKVVRS